MKIDGGCHCGRVTYQAEVEPQDVGICHCTDCQTLSGSAYRTVVAAIEGTFKWLTGAPKTYVKIAENGARRAQVFCPDCGTPILSEPAGEGSTSTGIRVGTVRQRDQLRPRKQYWCRSAQAWVQDLSAVVKIEKQ